MKPSLEPTKGARLDVREIPPREKHAAIFRIWDDLPVDSEFTLVNDHDPIPLFYQFRAEFPGAFDWRYLQRGPEVFEVSIKRLRPTGGGAQEAPKGHCDYVPKTESEREVYEIDARGLEPPEPLMRILNGLALLPAEATLRAITDRQPCHLFGEAGQRGFSHQSLEQSDGSWITLLRRA